MSSNSIEHSVLKLKLIYNFIWRIAKLIHRRRSGKGRKFDF